MIGYLRGIVSQKRESSVILECNGVGYEVSVPKSTQLQLPDDGEPVQMHTHLHVRQESQALYGFLNVSQRDVFRVLINISNIGPSHALNILSDLTLSDLVACVRYNDPKPLEKVPRIGQATAAKLLIELSNKIDHIAAFDDLADEKSQPPSDFLKDAVDALVVMGFSHKEAREAVSAARGNADDAEQAIRYALNLLGSTGT